METKKAKHLERRRTFGMWVLLFRSQRQRKRQPEFRRWRAFAKWVLLCWTDGPVTRTEKPTEILKTSWTAKINNLTSRNEHNTTKKTTRDLKIFRLYLESIKRGHEKIGGLMYSSTRPLGVQVLHRYSETNIRAGYTVWFLNTNSKESQRNNIRKGNKVSGCKSKESRKRRWQMKQAVRNTSAHRRRKGKIVRDWRIRSK